MCFSGGEWANGEANNVIFLKKKSWANMLLQYIEIEKSINSIKGPNDLQS